MDFTNTIRGGGHHFVKVFRKIPVFFKRWLPLLTWVGARDTCVSKNHQLYQRKQNFERPLVCSITTLPENAHSNEFIRTKNAAEECLPEKK